MPTRNSEVLQNFVDYCQVNPDLRFWQALKNWSGYQFVYVVTDAFRTDGIPPTYLDTFFWEGRNGKEI